MQIHGAMALMVKDIGSVSKDKRAAAQQGNFPYRGIDDLTNAVHRVAGEYGVYVVPQDLDRTVEMLEKPAGWHRVTLRCQFTFTATDGSSVTIGPVYGEAYSNTDKGTSAARSNAFKYVLIQTFLVPTQDMEDPDNRPQPNESAVEDRPPRPDPQPALAVDNLARFRRIMGRVSSEQVKGKLRERWMQAGYPSPGSATEDQLKALSMWAEDLMRDEIAARGPAAGPLDSAPSVPPAADVTGELANYMPPTAEEKAATDLVASELGGKEVADPPSQ